MSGNAGWGERQELEPGDYLTQIVDVKLDETEDFKDKTKKRPVFRWSVDVQLPDGEWDSRSIWTSRIFTDMSKVKDPKFVSGLNKLVRACGKPVPTCYDEAKAWDENSLLNCQFIWRIEETEDPETGIKSIVRKFLAVRPKAAEPAPVAPSAQVAADDDPFEQDAA